MTDDPLWLMEIPVVSTAHVRPLTCEDYLNKQAYALYDLCVAPLPWAGFFIFVPDGYDAGQPDTPDGFMLEHPDLDQIFRWATTKGYKWIRLDSEGSVIDELPTYNWDSS